MSHTKLNYDVTRVYTNLTGLDLDVRPPKLGTVIRSSDGKAYRFVKNNHSAALVVGDVVALDKTADYPNAVSQSGTDSCGATTTDVATIMGGVAVGAIPAAGYGWIQFRGVGSANVDGDAVDVVVGDSLVLVDSSFAAAHDAALSAAAAFYNHLRALKAKTDAASVVSDNVHINCRVY